MIRQNLHCHTTFDDGADSPEAMVLASERAGLSSIGISLRWIEESMEPGLAEARDYYSVPCLFFGDEKLYEAHFTHSYDRIKESIRAAFDKVLAA